MAPSRARRMCWRRRSPRIQVMRRAGTTFPPPRWARPWRVASPANDVTSLPRRLAQHPSAHSSDSDLDSLNAGTRDRLWLPAHFDGRVALHGLQGQYMWQAARVEIRRRTSPPLWSSSICFAVFCFFFSAIWSARCASPRVVRETGGENGKNNNPPFHK